MARLAENLAIRKHYYFFEFDRNSIDARSNIAQIEMATEDKRLAKREQHERGCTEP